MRPGLEQVRDKQFGVFTAWQVLCEYSRVEMRALIDRGEWVRVFRGVYREAGTSASAQLRVEAARLSMGVRSAPAAYGTAAELHGFSVVKDAITHVLGDQDSRCGRLIVHPDRVESAELVVVRGTVTTNAARTAVDVARTVSRPDALATLDAVLYTGLSRPVLLSEVERHTRRRGYGQAAELIELADSRARSALESRARLHRIDANRSAVCHHPAGGGPSARLSREASRWLRWRSRLERVDGLEPHPF